MLSLPPLLPPLLSLPPLLGVAVGLIIGPNVGNGFNVGSVEPNLSSTSLNDLIVSFKPFNSLLIFKTRLSRSSIVSLTESPTSPDTYLSCLKSFFNSSFVSSRLSITSSISFSILSRRFESLSFESSTSSLPLSSESFKLSIRSDNSSPLPSNSSRKSSSDSREVLSELLTSLIDCFDSSVNEDISPLAWSSVSFSEPVTLLSDAEFTAFVILSIILTAESVRTSSLERVLFFASPKPKSDISPDTSFEPVNSFKPYSINFVLALETSFWNVSISFSIAAFAL